MMSRRLTVLAFGLGLGLCALARPALADPNYLEQAIADTKEAIAAGKQGEPASFIEHVDDAYDHARSAVWQTPVDPIRKGIKNLRKAAKLAKGTSSDKRLDKATEQAEQALEQFQSVK